MPISPDLVKRKDEELDIRARRGSTAQPQTPPKFVPSPPLRFADANQSPWANPMLWDTLSLAGQDWVGRFEISGAERSYNWQIADGAGLQGAVETYRGRTPPAFSIKFWLYEVPFIGPSDLYAPFLGFIAPLFYHPSTIAVAGQLQANAVTQVQVRPNDPNFALTIYHPSLLNLGITQVIVKSIGGIGKESDDGLYSCTIQLQEFFPPLPTPAAVPDSAANPADAPFQSQAIKDRQATRDAALAQANALPLTLPF